MSIMKSLILIGGPTASGKTSLGVKLAQELNGEVISADSVQLFRGVEIGAATPTPEEQAGVPHHLLGVLDPRESVTAADFQRMADPLIEEITSRGRVPIIVGGSGLYLKALLYGLAQAPPRDDGLRARLEQYAEENGDEALWQRLRATDPKAAENLHANDRVRVIRALEVFELTGKSIVEHQEEHAFANPRYRFAGVGLTAERPWIHARINRRVELMLRAGLIEEVEFLLNAGVPDDAQPLTAIGLRETAAFLRQSSFRGRVGTNERVPSTREELADDIATHTRNFARRQLVLFRKEPYFRWFDAQSVDRSLAELSIQLGLFLQGQEWTFGEREERSISGESPTVRGGKKTRRFA